MKILITGGAGLIGRSVVDHLVRTGNEVVSIVRTPLRGQVGLRGATSEIVGDVADVDLVESAMVNVDAVVHLAAIPAPVGHSAVELLAANALPTMTVLEAAGKHRVKTVIIASSISVLGMAWAEEFMHPLYVPIDESHPLRPTEGYALSKEDDEAAARMASRRWGTTVVALRFPFTATVSMIKERAMAAATYPDEARTAAKELWAYLDVRDAARAVEMAITASAEGRISGALVLNTMADDVLLDRPVGELLAKWHPDVPLTAPMGHGAYQTDMARTLIGFEAVHLRPRNARNDEAKKEAAE